MQSLKRFKANDATKLDGVFFDLDDTLLDEGHLSEEVYASLFLLKKSGLRLIALTGRPASWGEVIARMWPIEAAISENGALAHGLQGSRLRAFDTANSSVRKERRKRLADLVRIAQEQLPVLVPADDVDGRISDYTFDIGEHRQVSESTINQAIELARRHGARTTRSSIHLHYTYDRTDKATGALSYLRSTGTDPTYALNRFAFIGDSQNDAPAFSAFRNSFGVSNLRGDFSLPPRFTTKGRASLGFCEFASQLSRLRRIPGQVTN